jgi:hypothetical protein
MSDRLHLLSHRTPPLLSNSPVAANSLAVPDIYDSDIERWGGGGKATDDDDDDSAAGGGVGFLQGFSPDLSSYKRRLSVSLSAVADTVHSLSSPPVMRASCSPTC